MASEATGVSGLAERYAAALFELADERHALDDVAGDLRELRAMLQNSSDLARLLRSPVLSRDEQGKAIAALAEQAGMSNLTRDFLGVVARNRRLFAVADILRTFRALLARERGEVNADVATAHALTPAQMQVLSDSLKASIGKNVQINTRVDPGLLGGLIVKVGSKMIDNSLRTKLNNLKVVMKGMG